MKFHVCALSVEHILRGGGAKLFAGMVRLNGHWLTEGELATQATILKAKGFEVFPQCDHHDSQGHCTGHLE